MARIKSLEYLKKDSKSIQLETLPINISIYDYALEKAYKINELVKKNYRSSYEWYGYLLGKKENPEVVIDIGLGKNKENGYAYTKISEEDIAKFIDELSKDLIINGWIHSHGNLNYRHFSGTDEENMKKVLNFVSPLTKRPIQKREIIIKNLNIVDENYNIEDLKKGSVTVVVNNKETKNIKIFETIYGSFSYNIVIGDEGWNEKSIAYEEKGVLTGYYKIQTKPCELEMILTGKKLRKDEIRKLKGEIKEKIKPYSFTYYQKRYWFFNWNNDWRNKLFRRENQENINPLDVNNQISKNNQTEQSSSKPEQPNQEGENGRKT